MARHDPETGPKSGCVDCRHFFITHEPARPYGCRRSVRPPWWEGFSAWTLDGRFRTVVLQRETL